MNRQEEARNAIPKKPMNSYFKFRLIKLNQYKDYPNRAQLAKAAWDSLTQSEKKALDDAYEIEKEQYRQDFKEWQEKYRDEIGYSLNKDKNAEKSEKESSDQDNKKLVAYKKGRDECFLRLRKQIHDELKSQRKEFAELSDS